MVLFSHARQSRMQLTALGPQTILHRVHVRPLDFFTVVLWAKMRLLTGSLHVQLSLNSARCNSENDLLLQLLYRDSLSYRMKRGKRSFVAFSRPSQYDLIVYFPPCPIWWNIVIQLRFMHAPLPWHLLFTQVRRLSSFSTNIKIIVALLFLDPSSWITVSEPRSLFNLVG